MAPPEDTVRTGKFKALCYCYGTGQIGAIESDPSLNGTIFALCATPIFKPDGTFDHSSDCTSDWVPLSRS